MRSQLLSVQREQRVQRTPAVCPLLLCRKSSAALLYVDRTTNSLSVTSSDTQKKLPAQGNI